MSSRENDVVVVGVVVDTESLIIYYTTFPAPTVFQKCLIKYFINKFLSSVFSVMFITYFHVCNHYFTYVYFVSASRVWRHLGTKRRGARTFALIPCSRQTANGRSFFAPPTLNKVSIYLVNFIVEERDLYGNLHVHDIQYIIAYRCVWCILYFLYIYILLSS